jgi:hypothetical protein
MGVVCRAGGGVLPLVKDNQRKALHEEGVIKLFG